MALNQQFAAFFERLFVVMDPSRGPIDPAAIAEAMQIPPAIKQFYEQVSEAQTDDDVKEVLKTNLGSDVVVMELPCGCGCCSGSGGGSGATGSGSGATGSGSGATTGASGATTGSSSH